MLRSIRAAILQTLLVSSAVAGDEPALEYNGGGGGAPLSESVRVDNMLYLSGMLGIKDRELVTGGIVAETAQALDNISAALARYGSSMDKVVRCTVFLADMAEWSAMNEVYVRYFPQHRPARSAVGVNGLAQGARVEIECTAVI